MVIKSIIKSRFTALALALALCVPAASFGMQVALQQQPGQQEPVTDYAARSTITGLASQLTTPYLLAKAGLHAEKSYGALAAQSFAVPALSYGAWSLWNKISNPEDGIAANKKALALKEKIDTTAALRREIILGGLYQFAIAPLIKTLLSSWTTDPKTGTLKKFGHSVLENFIAPFAIKYLIALSINWLRNKIFGNKKAPSELETPSANQQQASTSAAPRPAQQPAPVAIKAPQQPSDQQKTSFFSKLWSWFGKQKTVATPTPEHQRQAAAQQEAQAAALVKQDAPATRNKRARVVQRITLC